MIVYFTNDTEELLKVMVQDEVAAAAAAETHPVKVSDLPVGSFFESYRPDLEVTIYGEALPFSAEGLEPEEVAEEEASWIESRNRGYIFCKAFSRYCPRGEMGDTHITRITKVISREDFEAAKIGLGHEREARRGESA